MTTQVHPRESFFHEAVRTAFEQKLGLHDPELIAYIARVLCDFSDPGNLFRLRDEQGRTIESIEEMVRASDPIGGTAASFDEERRVRRYIGDYALFVAGMSQSGATPDLGQLIAVGKESYYIVSQFNVFEFEKEAPLFARLSGEFERCILGLAYVREALNEPSASQSPAQ